MGAGSEESLGDAGDALALTDAEYGERSTGFRLPNSTALGPVHLNISSLDRSLEYYEQVLGLRTVQRDGSRATLAAHGESRVLISLLEQPGVRPMVSRGRLGLYHVAILLPERAALARFAGYLAAHGVRAGAADHLVSEAFYLQDPDGLGIEVYADRPRSAWRRVGRELMMASDPLDMRALAAAAGEAPWVGMPVGTMIGHVHLHVGDIATASRFYSDALGFDRMVWQYPGALFLGAGGYHHHVGTNTWAGAGAVPPTAGDARLREWTIELPEGASLAAVAESLQRGGYDSEQHDGDLVTLDPWGTTVRLTTVGAGQ